MDIGNYCYNDKECQSKCCDASHCAKGENCESYFNYIFWPIFVPLLVIFICTLRYFKSKRRVKEKARLLELEELERKVQNAVTQNQQVQEIDEPGFVKRQREEERLLMQNQQYYPPPPPGFYPPQENPAPNIPPYQNQPYYPSPDDFTQNQTQETTPTTTTQNAPVNFIMGGEK